LDKKVILIALIIALIGITLISVTLLVRKTETENRMDEASEDCLKFLTPSECKTRIGV
jgi:hypothetical protein